MAKRGFVDEISQTTVHGWAFDNASPETPVTISIHVNGQEHGRVVANAPRKGLRQHLPGAVSDNHGFSYRFDPPLPTFRTAFVEVVATGSTAILTNGRRTLRGPQANRLSLSPLIVSSRGRSGTTVLMKWLLAHPDVVVADSYPYEVKFASYYATVLKVLATPKLDLTDGDPDFVEYAARTLQVGRNPWSSPMLLRNLGGPHLERLMEDSQLDRLASTFRSMIADTYGTIRLHQNKPAAFCFAEKCMLDEDIYYGVRSMLGDVREIVMVRDPRDFLCSAKKFWKMDPRQAFNTLKETLPIYAARFAAKGADTMFVRYEDVVLRQTETLDQIASHFGITKGRHGASDASLFSVHATSASPQASIGRWEKELTEAEIAECVAMSKKFMDLFDYKA